MTPKHHPTLLSGGDRKALNKELGEARAMNYKRSHLVALCPDKISAESPASYWWPGER